MRIATLLGVLGGMVAASAAAYALMTVGADPAYSGRVAFGWVALAFALLAVLGGALERAFPWSASALMLLGGTVGLLAISLFFITTWYVAALPILLAGAVLAPVEITRVAGPMAMALVLIGVVGFAALLSVFVGWAIPAAFAAATIALLLIFYWTQHQSPAVTA